MAKWHPLFLLSNTILDFLIFAKIKICKGQTVHVQGFILSCLLLRFPFSSWSNFVHFLVFSISSGDLLWLISALCSPPSLFSSPCVLCHHPILPSILPLTARTCSATMEVHNTRKCFCFASGCTQKGLVEICDLQRGTRFLVLLREW